MFDLIHDEVAGVDGITMTEVSFGNLNHLIFKIL